MRRVLTLALIAVALFGVAVPGAYAQAPAPTPQVTITGFMDSISSWSKNLQDPNFNRSGDTEWYARTRGRLDLIGALGAAKFVMGLEIDSVWGQVSGSDTTVAGAGANGTLATGAVQRSGATSAFDINTDTVGSIEMKWLYTEFPMPLVPFPTVVRLGAQPFGSAASYKLAVYANGDFPGVNIYTTFSPNVKFNFTYVAIEENLVGGRRGLGFGRGDDFALIFSPEITPFKGLDIKPMYSLVYLYGSTSGSTRPAVGQTQIAPVAAPTGATYGFARATPGGAVGAGGIEVRHTIGVDARWRSGPFSVDPTFYYQFGQRDTDNPFNTTGSGRDRVTEADISAMFFDVIGGWRVGPLLLEARYVYTSGNRPKDQLNRDVNYYQPLDLDTSYWGSGWGEILSLGIDYFNGAIRNMGTAIGMDRYGRNQFALRATYSVTPAFDLRFVVSPAWTARSIDTDGQVALPAAPGGGGAAGVNTCATQAVNSAAFPHGAGCRGDSSYIGTEANLGLTWRFAPGLTFDLVGAVLFAGSALDSSELRNGVLTKRDADNVYTIASRVRFSF